MWISRKKWLELEKRVADLEKIVQNQPQEIIERVSACFREQMTKSSPKYQWKDAPKSEGYSQETIDCIVQHLKVFHEQAIYEKVADFGEPCANCNYAGECKFNWHAKMQPLIENSNVSIRLCYPEHFRK